MRFPCSRNLTWRACAGARGALRYLADGHSRALACWLAAAATLAGCHAAAAHGIAGNRYFVGTLAFDDPSVSDEAIVPLYSAINYPAPGGNVAENRIHWSFDRLLTPTLALTYDGGWIHQS